MIPLNHAHEPIVQLPWFVEVALPLLVGYLLVAMLFGCPYCMLPDLAWPVTLAKHILGLDGRETHG